MFKKTLQLAFISLLIIGCGSKKNEVSAQSSTESNTPAVVTMVEYSDYQCPACGAYHPLVNQLKKDFGNQLEIEYRDFPLNMHPYAALAARAAESARRQDKFMEMHNMIFENQARWSGSDDPQSIFINYAQQMGLDMEQFRNDLNSAEVQRAVMEEKQEGVQRGVNATPTFYINGEKLEPLPRSYQQFKAIIQNYIDNAGNSKG